MSLTNNEPKPPPPPVRGTSLVDRINVALHLRRYLKLVGKRWLILAVCTAVGTGHASWRAYKTPNTYRATSTLGFKPKVLTESTTKINIVEVLDKFYETQLNLMQSSRVIDRVDEAMRKGKAPSLVQPGRTPRAVLGQGSTFQLIVESTDLQYARDYATAWAREFVKYKKDVRIQLLGDSAATTHEEKLRFEKKYEAARAATQAFLKEHNIASIKETGAAAQERLDKQQDEYSAISLERQRLEKQKPEDIAKGALNESPKTKPERTSATSREPVVSSLSDPLAIYAGDSKYGETEFRVYNMELEWKRRSETLRTKHPYMVKLQQEIQQLKDYLAFQLRQIQEKQAATIASLKIREESYLPIIQELKTNVQNAIKIQGEYTELKDEETNIKNQLDRLNQSLLAFDTLPGEEGQFEVHEEGVGPSVPVAPDRQKMILTGLLLGLAIGLGLAYLLHRLDDRLELAEDIEAELEEPMLGQIPQVDSRTIQREYLLITELDQYSFFSESIRGVRSAIMLGGQPGNKQVMLVSSAVPGDGKTTFTVNFAATLALAGHRVLLVDADLRRGNTHNYFGQERAPGFSEVLAGELHWTDVLRSSEISSLQIMCSGRLPANPGELLISPITRQFIGEARQEYDFVVFDCPPLTAIDDTFSLVGLADGLVFVVRAGQTSMRFAKNALAAVRQRGAPIFGLVLNGITSDNPYYYYNNYYHSYYTKTKAETAALSTAAPGVKMARPKMRAYQPGSIAVEAKTRAGEKPSVSALAAEEHSKTEIFKARRAAQRSGANADTSFIKKESAPAPSAQEEPKQT
ncbi:MAG: polysaccharide biosynthesis tyrosine autokinase [Chloroflexi bacterium]|nr:polysaccharide biosynthesis tyrosine autokinase [Chloroflexota bacterium]